jgi:WD40 repeat protein
MGAVANLEDEESVTCISFSKSNRLLFSAYKSLSVWDVLKEEKLNSGQGDHQDTIRGMCLSYDGYSLGTVSKDGLLQLWGQY